MKAQNQADDSSTGRTTIYTVVTESGRTQAAYTDSGEADEHASSIGGFVDRTTLHA